MDELDQNQEVLLKMMCMRGSRHRKAQYGGLPVTPIPLDYLNTSANFGQTDWSESRQFTGVNGFHFPPLNSSFGIMGSKKRTPPSTAEVGFSESSLPEIDGINLDDELLEALKAPLGDVSRQRLRAIQISFRRLGNLENQITPKELNSVLAEHNIKMPSRTYQLILKKFEGKYGVDFEPLWKFMVQAQSKTGRDSVIANNRSSNGLGNGQDGIAKEDYDLILKLHKALKGTGQYDLTHFRQVCQENDDSGHGVIPRKKFRGICVDQRVPLPGPLLNTLLKRCDDEKDGMINWSECISLIEQAMKFDPERYEKQNKQRKYQPLTSTNKTDTQENGTTSGSPTSSRPKSQAAKRKPGAKEAGDKDKKSQQEDSKAKSVSKDSSKTDKNVKAKPARPTTASSSRPKTATSRPGTAKSSDTKSSQAGDKDKTQAAQKKDGDKGQSSNKDDGSKKTSGIRSSPELNESASLKSSSASEKSDASTKSGQKSNLQRAQSARKTSVASKAKTGLAVASDDTEKEYLKQAQQQLNAPAKEKDKKTKGDVNNNQKSQIKAGNVSNNTQSKTPTTTKSDGKKDGDVPKSDIGPRPATAKVLASRPMTAKGVPPRPATAKVAPPPRPTTAKSEGRARSASGRKVVLNRDMEIDFNKVECHGVSKEKKESLISIYAGIPIPKVPVPIKKNSVAPEPQNFPGKYSSSKGNKGAKDSSNSKSSDKGSPLDSSQDSSVKSSTGSKSPDNKTNSSSNSLQSTSSSQASNASDQPLLSSVESTAKESLRSSISQIALKEKKEKEKEGGDGKLFKSFKGFLGMGKKKEGTEDDTKKLLEIESMSNTSQEGIELKSAAELVEETEQGKDKKQEEPSAEKPPDNEPPTSDPEKADYVLHGKAVSYYRPDEFMGKTICGDAPAESLQLDWVYGYRGNDCRCNMYVLQSGELVYFMAKVAILYDSAKHGQRHYLEHTADIKSLAVHPNQVTVATGQTAGPEESYVQACIRIWQSSSLETLHILGEDELEKTVISINFASSMNYLVAVDGSDGHTMSVWNTESGKKLADKKIATEVVCQVVFNSKRPQELITIGKEHMAYWSLLGEPLVIQEISKADYQTNMKAKYIICLAFKPNGDLVTGDSNGTVYVWADGGNTITQSIRHAHEGPVFSLLFLKNTLLTGGRDGLIQAWKFNGNSADMTGKIQIPSTEGGARMLQSKGNSLYIGTTLNGIVTAELAPSGPPMTGAKLNDKPLTRGHYDSLKSVVAHPSPDRTGHFITAGFDGCLMLYDANSHTTLWKHSMKGVNIGCLDINPSGSLIALGTKDSQLAILSISAKDEIIEGCWIKQGKTLVTCVKFSPDGDLVAIGCSDSTITIMRIFNEGRNSQPIGKCRGHTGAITALDWSVEKKEGLGYLLQSSSTSIEHLCWNTTTCKQLEDTSNQKNTKWISQTCLTGFYAAGAWGSTTDSPMIRSADRSKDQTLLVAGDSTGDVMMYRYPCAKPEASSKTVTAHSTETSCVRFLAKDTYVVSTGGVDCTVMQWKIMK